MSREQGGGVCLYVHENLKGVVVGVSSVANYPTVEFLLMEISTAKESVFMGLIYNPPNASFGTVLESSRMLLILII